MERVHSSSVLLIQWCSIVGLKLGKKCAWKNIKISLAFGGRLAVQGQVPHIIPFTLCGCECDEEVLGWVSVISR